MSIVSDLLDAVPFLAPIGAGVALLWVLGWDRDRTADQHDVADYQPKPVDDVLVGMMREQIRRRLRPALLGEGASYTPHILPPAPPSTRAPLYAETLFRTWHRETPEDAAARMLREIAAEQQAKVGIHPPAHWVAPAGGPCWEDCPGCALDLTGAFPVVRAA